MNLLLNLYLFALIYSEKKSNNMEVNIEFNKINKIPLYIDEIKNNTGYDFRNDIIEELNNTVLEYIQKHKLLLLLESNNISIFEKISIIDELDKENIYAPKILNGGLLDDWNDIF